MSTVAVPRRYLTATVGVAVVVIAVFALVTALRIPVLSDPGPLLGRGGVAAALLGVGLLTVDVLLPVPSSVVQVAHGAVFGVLVGTLLSFTGDLAAVLVGYLLGRRGSGLVRRVSSEPERERAESLLARWGAVAIIASRPVPVLAETVAVAAGLTRMRPGVVLAAGAAGSLPMAAGYAVAGATARADPTIAVFLLLMALAAAALLLAARRAPGTTGKASS